MFNFKDLAIGRLSARTTGAIHCKEFRQLNGGKRRLRAVSLRLIKRSTSAANALNAPTGRNQVVPALAGPRHGRGMGARRRIFVRRPT